MTTVKMKIVSIDELSQSLIVSFSSSESDPDDSNALAFQPSFFGELDRDSILKAIATAGLSAITRQEELEKAQQVNVVNSYSDLLGKTLNIDVSPSVVTVSVPPDNELASKIRAVLVEEGLIK